MTIQEYRGKRANYFRDIPITLLTPDEVKEIKRKERKKERVYEEYFKKWYKKYRKRLLKDGFEYIENMPEDSICVMIKNHRCLEKDLKVGDTVLLESVSGSDDYGYFYVTESDCEDELATPIDLDKVEYITTLEGKHIKWHGRR